jgi:predicted Zn-dependent protease with MMP-like domain
MTSREFDQLVEECMAVVPRKFREQLSNLVFVVEQEPPRPGLLGLYEGRPLIHRSVAEPYSMPDRITIYQGPHERSVRSDAELRDLVRETIWHEVAHYFGMDERQVLLAERRRRQRLDRLRGL